MLKDVQIFHLPRRLFSGFLYAWIYQLHEFMRECTKIHEEPLMLPEGVVVLLSHHTGQQHEGVMLICQPHKELLGCVRLELLTDCFSYVQKYIDKHNIVGEVPCPADLHPQWVNENVKMELSLIFLAILFMHDHLHSNLPISMKSLNNNKIV